MNAQAEGAADHAMGNAADARGILQAMDTAPP
jgi:hypothetical protein